MMSYDYKLFIGGTWEESDGKQSFPSYNPFTQKEWASIPQAVPADVERAIAAARRAFETGWRDTPGLERATLLNKLADLLEADAARMGELESTDNGKVIRETRGQMVFSARQYRFYAGFADKLYGQVVPLDMRNVFDYAERIPLGVVVLVTPWNSPMALLANKLAPALAAGNCVIIKPSEHASATTLEFAKLTERAGFPPGVVNVVTGDGEVGRLLCSARGIDKISFTGSAEVGALIAAAAGRNLVPTTMELGGKSPNVIFADADFANAASGALAGIFAATGQTCVAGSRLLVQRPIYGRMVEELAARAAQITMGDPLLDTSEMGTVANRPQFDRILGMIGDARAAGAELVTGGGPPTGDGLGDGLFIAPTIFADVRNSMDIAQQEVFGPVLSIIPFDTEEEAVAIANGTRYGLAAGVWTADVSRVMRMARAIQAGGVWVNTYRMPAVQAPFGGVKDSGFGRERGTYGIEEFTTSKNVMIDFSGVTKDPFAKPQSRT